jgi:hypothetical protein
MGQAVALLGYIARALSQQDRAQRYLTKALQAGAKSRTGFNFLIVAHALPGIALLLADRGDGERAVALYALAATRGIVGNSRWFEDIAGRHIAAVASALPLEVVAAAELSEELERLGWGEGTANPLGDRP